MGEYLVNVVRHKDKWLATVDFHLPGCPPKGGEVRGCGHMGDTPQEALEKLAKYWQREEALYALIPGGADGI